MTENCEPKKKLETSGGGSGRKGKTAIGADDGGYNFDPFGGAGDAADAESPAVVVCDRNAVIRDGLKALFEPYARVVGECATGRAAVEMIEEVHPGFVVLDVELDDMSGLELCRRFASKVNFVVATYSYHATKAFHRLGRSGVAGLVLKKSGPAMLFQAIKNGTNSNPYIDPQIDGLITQRPGLRPENLTDREADVLVRLGMKNQEIAEELYIKVRTVGMHIECIVAKLHVPSRTAAALKAASYGFVSLPVMNVLEEEAQAEAHAREAIRRRVS